MSEHHVLIVVVCSKQNYNNCQLSTALHAIALNIACDLASVLAFKVRIA